MWKLAASILSMAVVGGPVTVALAATDTIGADDPVRSAPRVETASLALETQPLADRGDDAERAAERRRRQRSETVRVPAALHAIAACESGGDPKAVGGGGTYRGKYQFSRETWASVGGTGDPAAAPESEQDRRAAMLYERDGAGHWPVCGA